MTPEEQRFWSFVDKTAPGCWLWKGSKHANGYGRIQIHGHRIGAHRIAYMLCVGHIDTDKVIHHECGNKLCVRPDHLKCVSKSEDTKSYYYGNGYDDGIGW